LPGEGGSLPPTERHAGPIAGLPEGESRADLVNDADLAAPAIEQGLALHSTDGGFSKFDGRRRENRSTAAVRRG
jgi:hypothetical protein